MSTAKCRFSPCTWRGPCDDLFTHCESHHGRWIRYLVEGNRYDFAFADLSHEAFLLCGKAGLYWFLLDPRPDEAAEVALRRGVFAIGQSEPIEYTLKLGLIRDGHADYLGPYRSRPEDWADRPRTNGGGTEEKLEVEKKVEDVEEKKVEDVEEAFEVDFSYGYLEFMNEQMPSRSMRLYVGAFDDSDDQYLVDQEEIDWTDADEVAVNQLCVERFTCFICFEFIRRDARFCERRHFVCCACFDEMVRRRRLRCPMCRSDYLYDCQDEKIERLLRMVKFPDGPRDESECEDDEANERRAGEEARATSTKRLRTH